MKRFREWWAQRRYGPMTRDRCDVCSKELRQRERVEIITDEMWESEFGGSTGWVGTYCKKDAPRKVST